MSRHEYAPPQWSAPYRLVIGWDRPLDTYFAQVMDDSIAEDEGRVVVWVGGSPPYHDELDALIRDLNVLIRGRLPEVTLSDSLRARLIEDRDAREAARVTTASGFSISRPPAS